MTTRRELLVGATAAVIAAGFGMPVAEMQRAAEYIFARGTLGLAGPTDRGARIKIIGEPVAYRLDGAPAGRLAVGKLYRLTPDGDVMTLISHAQWRSK